MTTKITKGVPVKPKLGKMYVLKCKDTGNNVYYKVTHILDASKGWYSSTEVDKNGKIVQKIIEE